MNNQPTEKKIDLKHLLSRYYSNWYYFAAALFIALVIAYVYIKKSNKIYAVSATIRLESQDVGSKGIGEILEVVEQQKRFIEVEDEIGLLTSFGMVSKAMERLDFGISYFTVEDVWLNSFNDILVEEKSAENFPFRVVIETSANQMLGVPIYIKILSKSKYQLLINAEEVRVFNIAKNEYVKGNIPQVNINKILTIGEPYIDKNLNFKIFLNEDYESYNGKKFYFVINNINSLTKNYQRKLQAKALSRDSRIVELQSSGEVVEKERKFLDTLISVYRDEDLKEKMATGRKTIEYIDKQLSEVTKDLTSAEYRLQDFKGAANLPIGVEKVNVYEKLDALGQEKTTLHAKLSNYNAILDYLERSRDLTTFIPPATAGIDNPALNTAFNTLAQLYQERAEKSITTKEGNPILEGLNLKINNQRTSVIENMKNLIASTNNALTAVNQRIGQLQSNVARIPENERQLIDLERKFKFNDETYNFLLEKRTEAAILLATNTSSKKVIDEAKMVGNGPISPKTNAIYLIAFLAALFIPAGVITVSDVLDDTIKTKEDVKVLTNIPVLGLIGHSDSKNTILAKTENHKTSLSESFRSLRVNLQYLGVGMDQKSIGLTSAVSGEGKTFCAINLSTVLALSGKKTILIDADLRKPKVASYLGLKNTVGLSSYLIKSNRLEEIIQPTKIKNLDVISSGPIPPNPVELLELKEMKDLLTRLKQEYDYVILDTPPIAFVSDYMVLKDYLDVNIFVVRAKYTKKESLAPIDELYENKTFNNLSIVINDVKLSSVYGKKANGYYS